MTKGELIEKLKNLPDETVIHVPDYDDDSCCGTVVLSIVEVGSDGSDGCEPEVFLY